MLTALRFMLDAQSGWIVPVFLVLGAAVFSGVWFLSWNNRTKLGLLKLIGCLLGAGLVCEIAWQLMFDPGGEYRNMGLGGTLMGLLFWPVFLMVFGVIAREIK